MKSPEKTSDPDIICADCGYPRENGCHDSVNSPWHAFLRLTPYGKALTEENTRLREVERQLEDYRDSLVTDLKRLRAILAKVHELADQDPYDMLHVDLMEPPWQAPCVLVSDLKAALDD